MCPIGPERSLLEPSADACKRVFLDSPILCPEATVVLGGLMHRWADGWWGCKCKGGNETGGKVGRTFVFVSWDRWVVLCGRERGGDKLLPTKQRCVDTQILIIPKSQVYYWSNIFEIRLYFVLLGWCGCDLLMIANESRVGVANRIELVAES